MRLLRESGERKNMMVSQGVYQQMMAGKVYQLLRVGSTLAPMPCPRSAVINI